ncbi:hypothetical protein K439DRAFT_1640152 [Ramaria rubella]|nr:hypothetical protein K439DRAFT_1640152 [Ramaria rubella]
MARNSAAISNVGRIAWELGGPSSSDRPTKHQPTYPHNFMPEAFSYPKFPSSSSVENGPLAGDQSKIHSKVAEPL